MKKKTTYIIRTLNLPLNLAQMLWMPVVSVNDIHDNTTVCLYDNSPVFVGVYLLERLQFITPRYDQNKIYLKGHLTWVMFTFQRVLLPEIKSDNSPVKFAHIETGANW